MRAHRPLEVALRRLKMLPQKLDVVALFVRQLAHPVANAHEHDVHPAPSGVEDAAWIEQRLQHLAIRRDAKLVVEPQLLCPKP